MMRKTKKSIELSQKYNEETAATEKALQKVSEKLIVLDEAGNIKKIPAKDL
jgi:hypothetical protein